MQDFLTIFAENVRLELQKRGHSLSWLARESGISQCMISNYLSCKMEPSLSKALQISYVLHIPLSQLVGENLLHPKTLVSIVKKNPEAERELLTTCPSNLLTDEITRRLKDNID